MVGGPRYRRQGRGQEPRRYRRNGGQPDAPCWSASRVLGDLAVAWVLELADGIAEECAAAGASVAGGDTSSADVVMLAITALGDLGGRAPVTRRGARPGDVVAVTGTLGSAAAGLALLSWAGLTAPGTGLEYLIRAHRRPEPPYEAGPQAAALGATSMIDISDGLVADLGHIAVGSEVQIEVDSALLAAEPVVRPGSLARAAALLADADWLPWVLAGGDDHALAATFPAGTVLPERWTVIGQVTRGDGVLVDGRPWDDAGGWEHFRVRLRVVSDQILNVTRPAGHLLDITTLMPRHRLEGRPRHRAKRQGFWPVRGVRMDATQAQDDRSRRRTSATARTFATPALRRLGSSSRPEYGRILRGAMLTPWFAVSVGIVTATSLTLATPHPALTFPPSLSGRCVDAGCATSTPAAAAPRPAIKHEVRLPAIQQRDANISVRHGGRQTLVRARAATGRQFHGRDCHRRPQGARPVEDGIHPAGSPDRVHHVGQVATGRLAWRLRERLAAAVAEVRGEPGTDRGFRHRITQVADGLCL